MLCCCQKCLEPTVDPASLGARDLQDLILSGVVILTGARDSDGSQILVIDFRKLQERQWENEAMLRVFLYMTDLGMTSMETLRDGFTIILIMLDVPYATITQQGLLTFLLQTLRNRYPARVRRFILVDPPWLISSLFALLRPFLGSGVALLKVASFAELHAHVSPERLTGVCEGSFPHHPSSWLRHRLEAEGDGRLSLVAAASLRNTCTCTQHCWYVLSADPSMSAGTRGVHIRLLPDAPDPSACGTVLTSPEGGGGDLPLCTAVRG